MVGVMLEDEYGTWSDAGRMSVEHGWSDAGRMSMEHGWSDAGRMSMEHGVMLEG